MKKITFYFLMLLSVTAFSQVEIVEDFESGNLPAGWTGDFNVSDTNAFYGCGTEQASGGVGAGQTAIMTTQNLTAVTNDTDLTVSFAYNVFEQVSRFPPPSFSAPAANWGSLVFEYSTDGGTNWTAAITIDDSNFTFVSPLDCVATGSVNVGTLAAGTDFQARFVLTGTTVNNFSLIALVDDISITQVATSAPNCTALATPVSGATDVEPNSTLTWATATGIPTGYSVSIGTSTGATDIVNAEEVTGTSYDLTGLLDYETEYFVSITPFNDFNGDDVNDYATGCSEESFTTRTPPITGATCGDPIIANPSPVYVDVNDTANFEDIVDANPCNSNYMRANDAFYQIPAATEDRSVDIQVIYNWNEADGNFYSSSVLLLDGCPGDPGTSCVVADGNFSVPVNPDTGLYQKELLDVVLSANQDYYVVLSSSSGNESAPYYTYGYNLVISQDECISPEMTISAVEDCANGGFSIDADITYLGDASSLTLSDGLGNSITNITETGIVNMPGPYTSGSEVTLTLTNDDTTSCFAEATTSYYCPPTNDECSGALGLAINTDDTCTITTDATNAGASYSEIIGAGTSFTCGAGNSDVWFSFEAVAESVIIQYSNIESAIGSSTALLSTEVFATTDGTCSGDFTSMLCQTGDFVYVSGLTIGDTYYIRNTSSNGGNEQNFTICLKTPVFPANDNCADAIVLTESTSETCDNAVSGTTVGASLSDASTCPNTIFSTFGDVWYTFTPSVDGLYEFNLTITSADAPSTNYMVYSGSCGAFTELIDCGENDNVVLTLSSSETYYVIVRSAQSTPGAEFDLCVWALPEPVENDSCTTPFELLESDDTGNNTIVGNMDDSYPSVQSCVSSYNTIWYSFTPNYTGTYNFDFTRVTGSAYYTVYNTDDCTNTSDNYITGFYSCYNSGDIQGDVVAGNTYLISIHASGAADFEIFAYPTEEALSVSDVDAFKSFTYYPNPVLNTLTVKAGNNISNISVRNIVGQEILVTKPNSLKTTVNMNNLNQGVYFVTVQVNGAEKTFKVVKK
ncbi:T9SS type A sorting domain-containing protein [Mangrovimonas cancribranchiae]|uniref:T9SS type A sorting domain-containing protein n=1 Tax=Mangrovimonas cancribranchiae TaxID=3080055 RepID=A0AAU6P5A5_9FLAO